MPKNKIDRFLDGELNINSFQEKESEFVDLYQKTIAEANSHASDFNPFVKIEAERQRRQLFTKRVLAYAASLLLAVSIFLAYQRTTSPKTEIVLSEPEFLEIENNTKLALLQFSQELNACLSQLENIKQMSEPVTSFKSLKNIDINKDNPLKNIKF